jgi:hypothetical protein
LVIMAGGVGWGAGYGVQYVEVYWGGLWVAAARCGAVRCAVARCEDVRWN